MDLIMNFNSFFLFSLCISSSVFAESNEPSRVSTSNPIKHSSAWEASGYIDGSYNYLLRTNEFTSGVFNRVYDLNPDGTTLHQASVTLAYQPKEGFGGLINPILGHDAFIFVPYGWNPFIGIQQAGFGMPQGYLQVAQGSFTTIGGEFNTLAGVEYLDPTKDTNFSRSILWGYAEPTTHLGVRSTYIVNKQISLIAGINNGWDSIRDTSRRKTLELSLAYTPNSIFSLGLVGYSGGQRAIDKTDFGPVSTRHLLDLIVTINPSEKLTFIASYDYGVQPIAVLADGILGKAIWQGFAAYINYKFNDKWRTSFRGEFFDDCNGSRTGVAQKWKEVTATIGYELMKNFELRAEARHDFSNVNSFLNASREGTSNNQQSYALEGVVKFS
jgi:hypothetical protein